MKSLEDRVEDAATDGTLTKTRDRARRLTSTKQRSGMLVVQQLSPQVPRKRKESQPLGQIAQTYGAKSKSLS